MNKYHYISLERKRELRKYNMCTRKVKYKTEEDAYIKNQKYYKCPYCGYWHRSGSLTRLNVILERRKLMYSEKSR